MNRSEFAAHKWGVFCHYLCSLQNGTGPQNTRGRVTDWNDCVDDMDCDRLASQISDLGASYLIFTMQQGTRHFIGPSESFQAFTGIRGSCSHRDLPLDLYAALKKRNIDLFLYFTGDGIPRDEDDSLSRRFGWHEGIISMDLVTGWSSILREYSLRYQDRVSGWWLDGVYSSIGYDDARLRIMHDAAKAGNAAALISNNYLGCFVPGTAHVVPVDGSDVLMADFYQSVPEPTPYCDFSAGELVCFNGYPAPDRAWSAVPHILSFLGIPAKPWEVYNGWGAGGCKYSAEYMATYIASVNHLGGVVSVDMRLMRDGSLTDDQRRALSLVNR